MLDKAFIERTPPEALHSEETMEEDDDFLSLGFEVWEYEIADGREDEFVNALSNSQMVIDYQTLDEEPAVSRSLNAGPFSNEHGCLPRMRFELRLTAHLKRVSEARGVGTISTSGLYTAPATISAQQTVTATSVADTTKSASATVTLNPPAGGGGYSYARTVTIDHTKVANSDQSNFPFLFSTTEPDRAA